MSGVLPAPQKAKFVFQLPLAHRCSFLIMLNVDMKKFKVFCFHTGIVFVDTHRFSAASILCDCMILIVTVFVPVYADSFGYI